MAERAKWYMVKKALSASTNIEGIRKQNDVAHQGIIIPGKWFRDVPDSNFNIILYDHMAIEAVEPEKDDYPLLYTLFPATFPKGANVPVANEGIELTKTWYKVDRVFTGLMALCSIEGICSVGDIAVSGDVIPARWFSGLSEAQLRELVIKQHIVRYIPDPYELDILYAKYPGADYKAQRSDTNSKPKKAKERK